MKDKNQVVEILLGIFFLAALAVSCATVPELKALYRLPAISSDMAGREVYFSLKDAREAKGILKEGAGKEFKHFPGNIVYSIAKYKEKGFRLGPYELTDMVKDGFKRRLENMGLKVLERVGTEKPELRIVLKEFTLDFVKRNWVARMEYEARIIKDGKVLATQGINAQSEKYKVIGTKGADQTMGEVFTDAVNRLDVKKLFGQARLF